MKNIFTKKVKSGFTLIELLVVVAIIGLLSSVVLASLNSARARGRDSKRLSDMKAMQTAIEIAKTSNIQIPSTYAPITSLSSILVPNYIPAIPTDPNSSLFSNATYYYCNVNTQGDSNYCHNDTDPNTYAIGFFTENRIGNCPGNTVSWNDSLCCLTSVGIFPSEAGNVGPNKHCTQR